CRNYVSTRPSRNSSTSITGASATWFCGTTRRRCIGAIHSRITMRGSCAESASISPRGCARRSSRMKAGAGEAATGQQQIVRLERVGNHFATGVEALSGVDLTVARGEFLSLLGPSGGGKSAWLRSVAGLPPPSGGHCHVEIGADLGRSSAGRIGFVFQDPTLMPWSTVTANVLLPFRIARRLGPTERERAHEAIRAV